MTKWILAVYGISTLWLVLLGVHPVFPWSYVAFHLLIVFPFSYVFARLLSVAQARVPRHVIMVGVLSGFFVTWFYRPDSLAFLTVAVISLSILVVDCLRDRALLRYLCTAAATLFIGFEALDNLNYLLARATVERLQDHALRAIDLAVYGAFVAEVRYEGIFPLVRSPKLYRMFEDAYLILIAEIFLVLVVLHLTRGDVGRFWRRVFGCYLLGMLIAFVYPSVSPCVRYPDSMDPMYGHTIMAGLGRNLAAEYAAIQHGEPVSGLAYFVGLPSLHVAVAVVLQATLFISRIHFWAFLPVNLMLIVSTVVVGQHYLLDLPAGLLLGALVVFASGPSVASRAAPRRVLAVEAGGGAP